jgi:predicted DNA-binding protein (MmcQ/YjbR family)
MEYDELEKKLLAQKGAVKDFPFGEDAAVFKVAGKMFALVAWTDEPLRITLKCDPEEVDFFRSTYAAIQPGYYMNKKHWNTISLDGTISEDLLQEMIESSYDLVIKGLTKGERQRLLAL